MNMYGTIDVLYNNAGIMPTAPLVEGRRDELYPRERFKPSFTRPLTTKTAEALHEAQKEWGLTS